MKIILVRHGKPDHPDKAWCTPRDMKAFVEGYQQAEVLPQAIPPDLPGKAHDAAKVVTSSLSRCIQSARHLIGDRPTEQDELYAEAHLPYLNLDWPRLPPKVWRFSFRAAWYLGFSAHTESIARSNQRARRAAARLIELAEQHGDVLMMGHGIMNILIAWHLRQQGWRGPKLLFLRGFWHASEYRKDK